MAIGEDKAKIVTFIPKELKRNLQLAAIKENKSLSSAAKSLLEEGLQEYSKQNKEQ